MRWYNTTMLDSTYLKYHEELWKKPNKGSASDALYKIYYRCFLMPLFVFFSLDAMSIRKTLGLCGRFPSNAWNSDACRWDLGDMKNSPAPTSWAFWGINLPRLLVLWQHWQSKPQRINFVLAPKHVFCWVPVVLDHYFFVEKTWVPRPLRWSKPLGALSQLRPVENWRTGGGIQSSHGARGGRTQMYEKLMQEMYIVV